MTKRTVNISSNLNQTVKPENDLTVRPTSLLTNLEITEELVSGANKGLKPNCAAGPDDI